SQYPGCRRTTPEHLAQLAAESGRQRFTLCLSLARCRYPVFTRPAGVLPVSRAEPGAVFMVNRPGLLPAAAGLSRAGMAQPEPTECEIMPAALPGAGTALPPLSGGRNSGAGFTPEPEKIRLGTGRSHPAGT